MLTSGNILKPAEEELKTGEWKYRVEASVMGRPLAAVCKFVRIDLTVVITVFEVE